MHHVIELTLIKLRGYKYQNKIQFVISTETTKIIMILTSLLASQLFIFGKVKILIASISEI